MIDTIAATTISRLKPNAIRAAWRTGTLSCRPAKVITPLEPLNRVIVGAERREDRR